MLAFKNIKAISAIISTHIFKSNLISKEVRQRCIFVRSVPNSFILVSCERYNKVLFAKWFKKSIFYWNLSKSVKCQALQWRFHFSHFFSNIVEIFYLSGSISLQTLVPTELKCTFIDSWIHFQQSLRHLILSNVLISLYEPNAKIFFNYSVIGA